MDILNSYAKLTGAVFFVSLVIVICFYVLRWRRAERESRINFLLSEVRRIMGEIIGTPSALAEPCKNINYGKKLEVVKGLLDKISSLRKAYPKALHYYALYHLKTGNIGEAEKSWQDATLTDLNSPHPHDNLANLYFEKKEYQKALSHHIKALQIDKNFDRSHVGIGNIKYEQGKLYSAMGSYNMAIEINSENSDALVGIGNCYQDSGNYKKATECYEQAFALDSANKHLNAVLSDMYVAKKEYTAAHGILEGAIKIHPYSSRLYKRFGDINTLLNKEKAAVGAYTNYLKLKCEKDSLTHYVRKKFDSYLALEIISDLIRRERRINYDLFIKELNTMVTLYLINEGCLGELNKAKKNAYHNFSDHLIKNVLILREQKKNTNPANTADCGSPAHCL